MALNQRRLKILNLIREDGHAKVQDLSKIFKVTDVTIRQDLEELEKMRAWRCSLKRRKLICQNWSVIKPEKYRRKKRNC